MIQHPSGRRQGWVRSCGVPFADLGSGGLEHEVTQHRRTFMAWNLMRLASMLTLNGGIPVGGHQCAAWDAGARFDHPNPEYR